MKHSPSQSRHIFPPFESPCLSIQQPTSLTCSVVQATVSIAIDIITPPLWKRSRLATGTRDGKTEEENHNLGSAIHACRDKVVPLDELPRAILAEVKLAKVANDEIDPDRGVDSDYEVAHVPEDDGQVQIAPNPLLREEFVHDVKWDREEEAEEISSRDPLVTLSK